MAAYFKTLGRPARTAPPATALRVAAVNCGPEFISKLREVSETNGWNLDIYESCSQALSNQGDAAVVIYDWRERDEDWRSPLVRLRAGFRSGCILLASPVVDSYLREEVVQLRGFDVLARSGSSEAIANAIRFAWFATRHSQSHQSSA